MKDKENLKKQIIYRSTHRGTKEMDLLIGGFVKKNINILNYKDLSKLKILIEMDDEILKEWYYDSKSENLKSVNNIFKMFKKFKF